MQSKRNKLAIRMWKWELVVLLKDVNRTFGNNYMVISNYNPIKYNLNANQ
jgi:uncharacterized protein YcbK (DUF882 family)